MSHPFSDPELVAELFFDQQQWVTAQRHVLKELMALYAKDVADRTGSAPGEVVSLMAEAFVDTLPGTMEPKVKQAVAAKIRVIGLDAVERVEAG